MHCLLGVGSQVLVGTTKNCILAGTLDLGFREAVLGHSDEVACLAGREGTGQFITASHDRYALDKTNQNINKN